MGVLLFTCILQPQCITHSLQALSSPIQRRYNTGSNHPLLLLLRALFELGTTSLALLMAVAAYTGHSAAVGVRHYGLVAAMIVVVVLVKALVDRWIQLTFRFTLHEKTYYRYRNELWMVVSLAMWVMMLFSPWLSPTLLWVLPGVVVILYVSILWWKITQAFGWNFQHMALTMMYMLHVEVLPIVVVIVGIGMLTGGK